MTLQERFRAALVEISKMRAEDLPLADGQEFDNLAAWTAFVALEPYAPADNRAIIDACFHPTSKV